VAGVDGDVFYIVSAAATEDHDFGWLQAQLDRDDVQLTKVTEKYGVLTLAGPRSRELLQAITGDDVTREAFPFFRARRLDVGLALRVSYVGELGFELHHDIDRLPELYDR